ncbi:MAG: hypothetical protein KME35_10895 [Aphanocapsa sp. GSE-SYN-MK-11-07L]|jgi:hypothetical protein|nr:hypothetical protein [Aphanocapsa sp. GSE-SYN-MK-11-07L]
MNDGYALSASEVLQDWQQRMIKLRRRLISLPAETAESFMSIPWIENNFFYARYQAYRDRHQSKLLPLNQTDQKIVDSLVQTGLCRTSLQELQIPDTEAFLQAARAIFGELEQKRSFAQGTLNASFDQLIQYPNFLTWGLQDRLLKMVENYLELPVAYDTFTCTLTLKAAQQAGTRLWHIDHEDRRMIKLIIYLTDVDQNSGPFQYIQPEISLDLLKSVPSRFDFLTEQELKQYLPASMESPFTSCTGKAGTVIFVDTARSYHRGKPPSAGDRQAVFFGYFSRRPRYPFRCGRSLLSKPQLNSLSAHLPAEKQACLNWQQSLPTVAKLIPRYRYYNL